MNIRVPITSTDTRLTESAARLRFAIVRTARRLRQEAAGAGDRALADLGLGAGHGRAPRPADPERAGRDRADQAADRDPHAAGARGGRPGRSRRPIPATAAAPWSASTPPGRERLRRLRGRKNAYLARRMRDLPDRRRRDPGARRRDPRGDPGGALGERRRPPQLRLPLRPQLPPLLRRADGLALGQLDADGGRDLADPHA